MSVIISSPQVLCLYHNLNEVSLTLKREMLVLSKRAWLLNNLALMLLYLKMIRFHRDS